MQQTAKFMDDKIKLALNDLNDVVINKIEEIKRLEKKITELSIKNAQLQDEVANLKNSEIKNEQYSKDIQNQNLISKLDKNLSLEEKLINDDVSEDIDISINQLKSIISKKTK
jgi:predicted RNase H-like nuclease (RuvC/YqgF family)